MINIALPATADTSRGECINITLGEQNHLFIIESSLRLSWSWKKVFFLFCQQPWRYIQAINDSKILFHSAVILPVRSNLQVNGTNTSLIHSSINCGHVTISAQHFLMIILSPTLCVIITPALLVMYLPSGEMPEIIYTVSLLQLLLLG